MAKYFHFYADFLHDIVRWRLTTLLMDDCRLAMDWKEVKSNMNAKEMITTFLTRAIFCLRLETVSTLLAIFFALFPA